MLGESIAHYKITAKLGAGGMGALYRATDTKLNREVAIKVLPDTFASDPDRLARFTREAQVLASLNHPNIATIFGVENNTLIMELIEGNDLAGPLPLNEALQIARQIAEGLEAAHDKGIIHRDLKPANIKVTPDGIVKILDFGLAKASDATATTTSTDSPTMTLRATQAGLIMGTAGYMSPEQAAGKTVDKRADIWAFGVVLHELLTGKRLFHGETVSHTLASVLKDPINFAIPQAPQPIQALLARCLDRNFKHRYKDISEACIAIEDFLANPQQKEPTQPTTRPTLWIALAATFLLAFVAALLWPRVTPSDKPASHFNISGAPGSFIVLSPDGKWLLKLGDGEYQVRRLDSPNWRALSGTMGESLLAFWSEDSTAIGFVSANRLRLIRLDGSPSRELMEVKDFLGASWRGGVSDGTILLASHGKLKTYDLRPATIKDLPIEFKSTSQPAEPVFLPEGDGFVFLQQSDDGMRLFRASLNSSTIDPSILTHRMVQFARNPTTGKWHVFYFAGERELRSSRTLLTAQIDPKSGNLLSTPVKLIQGISTIPPPRFWSRFSVGGGGVLSWTHITGSLPIWHLNWVDPSGNLLARVTENRSFVSFALSPDESKIAAQIDDPDTHVWILNSTTGVGRRISNSSDQKSYPLWARDGKSVFYVSSAAGGPEIKRHFLDNATQPELLWKADSGFGRLSTILAGVTPEGRYLLVQTATGSRSRLDLQAPSPRELEPLTQGLGFASLSLDGRSLAWSMSREGGLAAQAYPPTSGPPNRYTQSAKLINQPFFRADGGNLYAHYNRNHLAFPLSQDRRLAEPKILRP